MRDVAWDRTQKQAGHETIVERGSRRITSLRDCPSSSRKRTCPATIRMTTHLAQARSNQDSRGEAMGGAPMPRASGRLEQIWTKGEQSPCAGSAQTLCKGIRRSPLLPQERAGE